MRLYRMDVRDMNGEELSMGPQDHREVIDAQQEARLYSAEHPAVVVCVREQITGAINSCFIGGMYCTNPPGFLKTKYDEAIPTHRQVEPY